MYCIALCDDEEQELDEIETFLARYQAEKRLPDYRIRRFTEAEALLKLMREEGYVPDLLLLDIYMNGKTGVEAAREVRDLGIGVPIMFLTTSKEHALSAYEVDAVQYLVKPVEQERFFHAMDLVEGQIQRSKDRFILIKVPGGVKQLQPDHILYCESQKNYQILHLEGDETYKVRMTTESLWKLLERFPQFGRCGRSYILNMNHIVSVEREEIVMDDQSAIYMPRYKAAEFKKSYFAYYFERDAAGLGSILTE